MNDVVTANNNQAPIFLFHPLEGSLSVYNDFVKKMGNVQCYGVRFTPNVLDKKSIPAMAAYYVEQIQKIQTHGPYRFVGLSYGACLALEIAHILEAKTSDGKELGQEAAKNLGCLLTFAMPHTQAK